MRLKGRHALLAAIVACGLLANPAGAVTHELRHNSVEEVNPKGAAVSAGGDLTFSTFLGAYTCLEVVEGSVESEAVLLSSIEVFGECEGTGALESCSLKSQTARAEGEPLSGENPWVTDVREDTALGITGVELELQFVLKEGECEIGKITATLSELVATPDDAGRIAALTLAGEGVVDVLGSEFELEANGAWGVAPEKQFAISSEHDLVKRVVIAEPLEGEPETAYSGTIALGSFLGTLSCAAHTILELADEAAGVTAFTLTKESCEGTGELAECEIKSAIATKGGEALSGSNAWEATIVEGNTSLELADVEVEVAFELEAETCEVAKSLFTFPEVVLVFADAKELEKATFGGEGTTHILGLELEAAIEGSLEGGGEGTYAVRALPPEPPTNEHDFTDDTESIAKGGVPLQFEGELAFENIFGGYQCNVVAEVRIFTGGALLESFAAQPEECKGGSGTLESCELTGHAETLDGEPLYDLNPVVVSITEVTDLTLEGTFEIQTEFAECEIEELTLTFDSLLGEPELEGGYLNAINFDNEDPENEGITDLGPFELVTVTGGTLEVAEADGETISID